MTLDTSAIRVRAEREWNPKSTLYEIIDTLCDEVDSLRAENAEWKDSSAEWSLQVTTEIASLRSRLAEMENTNIILSAHIAEKEKKVERLREALRKYGSHTAHCRLEMANTDCRCFCGYRAALEAGEKKSPTKPCQHERGHQEGIGNIIKSWCDVCGQLLGERRL